MSNERKTVATVLRVLAVGASSAGAFFPTEFQAAAKVAEGLLTLTAGLVEKVGIGEAEKVLEDLIGNPAKPITREELEADVQAIRDEFRLNE